MERCRVRNLGEGRRESGQGNRCVNIFRGERAEAGKAIRGLGKVFSQGI